MSDPAPAPASRARAGRKIQYLIVHHNGVPGRMLEHIRRTHLAQGWKDVGYHWVIEESGAVRAGRPEPRAGAHVDSLNANTLGVCVIGNGNVRDFNEDQYKSLVGLLANLCERYALPAGAVLGHRETRHLVPRDRATKKTCPGTCVDLNLLRERVADELDAREHGRAQRV